jgi:hypothetical protein
LFYISDPPCAAYQTVLELFRRGKTARTGNSRDRRATFLSLLKRAGFIALDVEPVLAHSEHTPIQEFLTTLAPKRLIDSAERDGLLTPAQAAEAARDIEAFFLSGEVFFALIMFIACGEKPGGGHSLFG